VAGLEGDDLGVGDGASGKLGEAARPAVACLTNRNAVRLHEHELDRRLTMEDGQN
jgi:hypothetical protein